MTKFCPECGTENPENADFCSECGADFKGILPKSIKSNNNSGKMSEWWNKQSSWVKITIFVGLCCLGLLVIFFVSNTGPIGKEAYAAKISDMDKQFREIIKDNSMYTTAGKPWREEEPVLKNILNELNQMEKRGIPSEYKTFHEHFKKSIETYLLWQNTANDEYEEKFFQEDNMTKELWNSIE